MTLALSTPAPICVFSRWLLARRRAGPPQAAGGLRSRAGKAEVAVQRKSSDSGNSSIGARWGKGGKTWL